MRRIGPTLIHIDVNGTGRAVGVAIRTALAAKSRPVLRIGSMMQIELSQPYVAQCFAMAFEEGRSVEVSNCGLLVAKGHA